MSDELGLKLDSIDMSVLGTAKKVIVSKDETTIVSGGGDKADVEARVAQIRAEIEKTDSDYDREKLQERLAKLAGGVAVIKVGAATEVEAKERKHRIEDAVRNAKAAIEEGLLPGGGVALVQAAKKAESAEAVTSLTGEEATGAAIVFRAIEAPIKQIAENSGVSGDVVFNKVRELPEVRVSTPPPTPTRICWPPASRPGQGHPLRSAERRVHRRPVPDHRSGCRQQAGTEGRRSGRRRRHGLLIRSRNPPSQRGSALQQRMP